MAPPSTRVTPGGARAVGKRFYHALRRVSEPFVLIVGVFLAALLSPASVRADGPRVSLVTSSGDVSVPFQLQGDHLLVEVRVNGRPARFVLDSGAGLNAVTPEAAARLGLALRETPVRARGAGAESVLLQRTEIALLEVGGASLLGEAAYALPLPPALACDGLLGYPFLARFVTTIDYARRRLTLALPERFRPPRGAEALALQLVGNIPQIEAVIDGRPGRLKVDTGAGDALILFAPFVERHRLRERYSPRIETITGRGVGGYLYGDLVRLPSLKLGRHELSGLIAELSRQSAGAFHDETVAGNLGAEVLRRFTVTLDYPGRRLFLAPNRHFRQPFERDRTGLAVDLDETGFVVVAVVPAGPGADAGIAAGDRVLAVEGTPAARLAYSQMRAAFRRPPGTRVKLTIQTGPNPPRETEIVLKDLL